MRNILTIDLEEWFHLLEHEGTATESQWTRYPPRINEGTGIILNILKETGTSATFFIVGWIAHKHPDVVHLIDDAGYEIACQSDLHKLVSEMTPGEFREDTLQAMDHIHAVTGKKVTAYRAPGFSITETTPWAFEILSEAGITHDSSVFPAARAHGGFPSFPSHTPAIIKYKGITIKEFPITTTNLLGNDIVFGGGGYFRLFPYPLTRHWTKQQEDYLMAYIHPRDLDYGQPMLPGLSPLRRFKSYYGIKGAEQKLRKWLTDFQFTDIRTFDKNFDWGKAPVVELINK